jgi:glutaredoxin-like protein NrdH
MAVTVYTNPNCVQCESTKRFLNGEGIAYDVQSLQAEENYDKLVEFVNQGFKAAPIVVTDNDIWSGFRLDKLKALAKELSNDNN